MNNIDKLPSLEYLCDICNTNYILPKRYDNTECCDYPLWYTILQTELMPKEFLKQDFGKYIIDFNIAIQKDYNNKK